MATYCSEYNFNQIEPYWQAYWDQHKTFKAYDLDVREKFFVLDMFPYPSGAGLHIGHPEGYTATDIIGRYKMSKGYNVLHPMGWDAFGLPAEQHAVSTGMHPAINTASNIENFKKQIKALGFGLDWDREINTTDPAYYRWTQWIFLKLFKQGLAYVDEKPIWWCPELATVLANEEVIDGRSERGNHPVERRKLRQWVLRITAYAEVLLEDLKLLNWPESTKRQQAAWIGKSEGAYVTFKVQNHDVKPIQVFTTRVDTLMGVTYVVLAPEHPLVQQIVIGSQTLAVQDYIESIRCKSDLERTELSKIKTGVFTGSFAVHPMTQTALPIWIADYVLGDYGTGAVMAVPAHDERDYIFAQKYNLPQKIVVVPLDSKDSTIDFYAGQGILTNSGEFDGLRSIEAKISITQWLEIKDIGSRTVNYKLRDWLFSRQRYWGEPIPILWIETESWKQLQQYPESPFQEHISAEPVSYHLNGVDYYALPLTSEHLPLLLPEVTSYLPSQTGESPLANKADWVNVFVNLQTGALSSDPQEGPQWVRAQRETNTMPQWAGSCWYYLRYLDPHNTEAFVDPNLHAYWGCPDLYIGGSEHAVLHLLYARFWHKVLYDLKLVSQPEPFKYVVHQGPILGEVEYIAYTGANGQYVCASMLTDTSAYTHKKLTVDEVVKQGDRFVLKTDSNISVDAKAYKMSKSRGNVISPDSIIQEHGADALRLYEMFLGPLEAVKPWSTRGIEGINRFLKKVWRLYVAQSGQISEKLTSKPEVNFETLELFNDTIQKVSEGIEALHLNTAISQMMIWINHAQKLEHLSLKIAKAFLQLLAPFAPHIAEELWARLGASESIVKAPWPEVESSVRPLTDVKIVVQINGKMRGILMVKPESDEATVLAIARADARIWSFIETATIQKIVYIPNKLLSLATFE